MHTRIQQLIQHISSSASQFADEIGVQRSSISHLLSGRNKPSADFLQKLLQSYPAVSIDWLLTGNGTMFTDSNSAKQKSLFSDLTTNTTEKPAITTFIKPTTEVEKQIITTEKPIEAPVIKGFDKKISRIVIFYSDNSFEEYINK